MSSTVWQRHAARAKELISQNPAAAEVLHFLAVIARLQGELWQELESASTALLPQTNAVPRALVGRFRRLLSGVASSGPVQLAEAARSWGKEREDVLAQRLNAFWTESDATGSPPGPDDFFPRAFLQPYAALLRSRADVERNGSTPCLCPVCGRKPGVGVLRPMGDGGQRSLICSLCLYEWEFRRILCPACGEEDPAKLPVYTAEELKDVRVECCDTCRSYIKTVDMTKNGRAEPVVDEIAALSLDVWAQRHGYSKLRLNLMQF